MCMLTVLLKLPHQHINMLRKQTMPLVPFQVSHPNASSITISTDAVRLTYVKQHPSPQQAGSCSGCNTTTCISPEGTTWSIQNETDVVGSHRVGPGLTNMSMSACFCACVATEGCEAIEYAPPGRCWIMQIFPHASALKWYFSLRETGYWTCQASLPWALFVPSLRGSNNSFMHKNYPRAFVPGSYLARSCWLLAGVKAISHSMSVFVCLVCVYASWYDVVCVCIPIFVFLTCPIYLKWILYIPHHSWVSIIHVKEDYISIYQPVYIYICYIHSNYDSLFDPELTCSQRSRLRRRSGRQRQRLHRVQFESGAPVAPGQSGFHLVPGYGQHGQP